MTEAGEQPHARRVCLVTGASAGIGRATALHLATSGARLILVARNRDRGQAALDDVIHLGGGEDARLLIADLADVEQVRQLSRQVRSLTDQLHVLINNAGVIPMRREMGAGRHELALTVNHLAPFVFNQELLPLLQSSAPARILNVTSVSHRWFSADWQAALRGDRLFIPLRAYGRSKLISLLVNTYELARRLDPRSVTVNAYDPGIVRTKMLSLPYRGTDAVFQTLLRPVSVSAEAAAARLAQLALDSRLDGVTGRYFRRAGESRSSPTSRDPALAQRLWCFTEALVGDEAA